MAEDRQAMSSTSGFGPGGIRRSAPVKSTPAIDEFSPMKTLASRPVTTAWPRITRSLGLLRSISLRQVFQVLTRLTALKAFFAAAITWSPGKGACAPTSAILVDA